MILPDPLRPYFISDGETLGSALLYQTRSGLTSCYTQIDNALRLQKYVRVFEHFWLPGEVSGDLKKMLVQSLFLTIANNYDSIITPERNLQCYEQLYAIAKARLPKKAVRVLDFGCGTGIVTQTTIAQEIPTLRGFDFCSTMSSIARNKGLAILDSPLSETKNRQFFDLILASYVFHYDLTNEDWIVLLSCVTDHGAIIGNFHKGLGLPQAIQALDYLKALCTYEIEESNFGPVLVVTVGPKDKNLC